MIAITAPLPNGKQNTAYSESLSAMSGVPPYTWAAETDQGQTGLPPGLTISSLGVISGTIGAVTGTFNSTIKVTDHDGQLGAMVVLITVTA